MSEMWVRMETESGEAEELPRVQGEVKTMWNFKGERIFKKEFRCKHCGAILNNVPNDKTHTTYRSSKAICNYCNGDVTSYYYRFSGISLFERKKLEYQWGTSTCEYFFNRYISFLLNKYFIVTEDMMEETISRFFKKRSINKDDIGMFKAYEYYCKKDFIAYDYFQSEYGDHKFIEHFKRLSPVTICEYCGDIIRGGSDQHICTKHMCICCGKFRERKKLSCVSNRYWREKELFCRDNLTCVDVKNFFHVFYTKGRRNMIKGIPITLTYLQEVSKWKKYKELNFSKSKERQAV